MSDNDEIRDQEGGVSEGEPSEDIQKAEEISEELPQAVEPTEGKVATAVESGGEARMSGFAKLDMLMQRMVRTDVPDFRPGDTVRVHVKIVEGGKERIQVFEGVVIALEHGKIDRTFTVRKTSWGVGVERTFFINSPKVAKIELVRRGRVKRAKLYYLRQRSGKAARIAEKRRSEKEKEKA